MFLSGDSSIIGFIVSFPYFLDIILFLFLLFGASIGYSRGFWRGTFNLICVVIMLLISWFVLLDALGIFVNTRLFSQLGITFKIGENEAKSVQELVEYTVELYKDSLPEKFSNPDYVSSLALTISKSIAWLIVVMAIHLFSWIISGILYFLIVRLIIPKKLRRVKLRLLGALMGLIQTVVIIFSYMISFSNISPAFATIKNCGEGALAWCNNKIQMIIVALDPYNSMLVPLVESSENKFKFTVDSNDFKLNEELKEFLELVSDLNDKYLNGSNEDETGDEEIEQEEVSFFVSDYLDLA